MLKHWHITPGVRIGRLSVKRRRIQQAIEALLVAGAPAVGLSDTELYGRVAQQLKAQNHLPHEIPSLSTFRRHIEEFHVTAR